MNGSVRFCCALILVLMLGATANALELQSAAFADQATIPGVYTCTGENVSPPLSWTGVPATAESLVLTLTDPDAPVGTWVHWLLYNLPPQLPGLPEKLTKLPPDSGSGRNSWGETGYGGPCPPSGTHRYIFRLFALDRRLDFSRPPSAEQLRRAMRGHILDRAELLGRYRK